jgi:hypothetical protein
LFIRISLQHITEILFYILIKNKCKKILKKGAGGIKNEEKNLFSKRNPAKYSIFSGILVIIKKVCKNA